MKPTKRIPFLIIYTLIVIAILLKPCYAEAYSKPYTEVITDSSIIIKEIEVQNPRYTLTDSERLALQKIALAEAQSEGICGMTLVMLVILNRVESDKFPDTIEEVISQEGQFATYPKAYNSKEPTENSEKALYMIEIMNNQGALYFENAVPGSWQSTHLDKICKVGKHTFYK